MFFPYHILYQPSTSGSRSQKTKYKTKLHIDSQYIVTWLLRVLKKTNRIPFIYIYNVKVLSSMNSKEVHYRPPGGRRLYVNSSWRWE